MGQYGIVSAREAACLILEALEQHPDDPLGARLAGLCLADEILYGLHLVVRSCGDSDEIADVRRAMTQLQRLIRPTSSENHAAVVRIARRSLARHGIIDASGTRTIRTNAAINLPPESRSPGASDGPPGQDSESGRSGSMERIITDAGRRWTAMLVGPYGINSRPCLWDVVFRSVDGERIAVPIRPGDFHSMAEGALVALLRKTRRQVAVTVGGPMLPDGHIEPKMSVGTCTDPEHEGPRNIDAGRHLIPFHGPVYFACVDCLRHLVNEGALPAWAARVMRAASTESASRN